MTLVQGINLSKSYDEGLTYIFTEINFTVDQGKHIALTGPNGAGKTTLLKVMAGSLDVEGTLQVRKNLQIGYQVQEPVFDQGVTVREVLEECFRELMQMGERLGELERLLALSGEELEKYLDEYGTLLEKYQLLGGYSVEQEILRVAGGLGFTGAQLVREASSLSGGEKSKLLLACQLLQKPDLLLLDEPTNHLDLESLEWLEGFLQGYPGTFIIISHDRYFLDQVAREIWEMERGKLEIYAGNYTRYVQEKEKQK